MLDLLFVFALFYVGRKLHRIALAIRPPAEEETPIWVRLLTALAWFGVSLAILYATLDLIGYEFPALPQW